MSCAVTVIRMTNGNIIIVDYNLDYYLVRPDLTYQFLFTSTSYNDSKQQLEHWMAEFAKRS